MQKVALCMRNEHKKRINKDHISRHSFAKMAKDKGLDNLEVKALLAHSNLATTQRYMGEFDTAHNDAALEKVFLPTDERAGSGLPTIYNGWEEAYGERPALS